MLMYFTCMLLLMRTTQSNGTVQMFKNINVISTYNVYTVQQDSMMKNKQPFTIFIGQLCWSMVKPFLYY